MASRTLEVVLNARDNLSGTFKKAGDAAKTLTESLNQLSESGKGFEQLSKAIDKYEGEIRTVGTTLTAFGAAGTAALGFATRASINLEKAMANVNSIAGLTEKQLDTLTDQVIDLAVEMGAPPTELAEGLYDLISSGVDSADAMGVLETAVIAANAGMTDTATAVRAITAVLNAYGMEAEHAGDISDLLFKTVDSGVISFEGLANNLSAVLPLAASLRVGFEEVSAAFAELTLQGFSAAQAETGIAAVMRAAINPTQELTAAVQALGYTSVEALISAEGLTGFLAVLEQASGGSNEALMNLLGTSEATTAVLALLSGGVDGFTARVSEMEGVMTDGAYAFGVFQTQSDTTAFALERLGATVTAFQVSVGDAIAPMVRFGAEGLTAMLEGFIALPGPMQTAVAGLAAFTSGSALALGSAALVVPKVIELQRALVTLSPALATATATLGLWAAGLTAATIAGAALGYGAAKVWQSFEAGELSTSRLATAFMALVNGDVITFFRSLATGADDATEAVASFTTTIFELWNEAAKQGALGNEAVAQDLEALALSAYQVEKIAQEFIASGELRRRAMREHLDTGESLAEAEERLREEFTLTSNEIDARSEALNAIARAYLDPTVNAEQLRADVMALDAAFKAGDITLDEHTAGLADIAREYGTLEEVATGALASIVDGGAALRSVFGDLEFTGAETITDQIYQIVDGLEEVKTASDGGALLRTIFGDLEITEGESVTDQIYEIVDAIENAKTVSDGGEWLRGIFGGAMEGPSLTSQIEEIVEGAQSIDEQLAETAGSARTSFQQIAEEAEAAAEEMRNAFGEDVASGINATFDAIEERAQAFTDQLTEGVQAVSEYIADAKQQFMETGLELAGWDNALSQINFTSLASDSSLLAESLIRSGDALDNVFRAIVSNTDAIASQVQGVEDWALELINVAGEYGKIDDLLADGLITIEQYNAAQQAQVDISRANASVQNDILAIQAMQAPYIAEMTAAQAAYVEQLRQAPAEQQRLALAWMDTNTAAQAHEGILLANSVAMGEWGKNGEVAFEGFIRGAVQANPLLFDIWESVGLISGTPMDFTVNTDGLEGAQSELGMLIDSLDRLTMVLAQIFGIEIEVEGADEVEAIIGLIEDITGQDHSLAVNAETGDAQLQLAGLTDYLREVSGQDTTVTVDGDITPALGAIADVLGVLSDTDGESATVLTLGNNAAALASIGEAAGALNGLDGDTATVYINAISNVGAAVGAAAAALAGIDGRTATTYVNTVYSSIGSSVGAAFGGRALGGMIPEFASGGLVPIRAGEHGPEIARFANGGTAVLPSDGFYAVPPLTTIIPAHASSSQIGGDSIVIDLRGSTFGSEGVREEVLDVLQNDVIPQWEAAQRRRLSMIGV